MEQKELTNDHYAENRNTFGIGLKAGLAPMFLFFVYIIITSLYNTNFSPQYLDTIGGAIIVPILILWPAVVSGIVGAWAGKYLKKTQRAAWTGALLGALPTSAMIIYVFSNYCIGFC